MGVERCRLLDELLHEVEFGVWVDPPYEAGWVRPGLPRPYRNREPGEAFPSAPVRVA